MLYNFDKISKFMPAFKSDGVSERRKRTDTKMSLAGSTDWVQTGDMEVEKKETVGQNRPDVRHKVEEKLEAHYVFAQKLQVAENTVHLQK